MVQTTKSNNSFVWTCMECIVHTHTHCSLYEIGLDSFIRVQWNFFRILPNSEFNSSNYYRYCLRRYNSITNKLALDCSTVLRLCFKTRQNTICTQRWWTCNDTSTIDIQLGIICQLISETFAHHLIACLKVYALFRVVFTHKSKSFRLFSVKCKIPIWQMLYFNCTINGLENSNETKKKLQFLCKFPQ